MRRLTDETKLKNLLMNCYIRQYCTKCKQSYYFLILTDLLHIWCNVRLDQLQTQSQQTFAEAMTLVQIAMCSTNSHDGLKPHIWMRPFDHAGATKGSQSTSVRQSTRYWLYPYRWQNSVHPRSD